MSEEKKEEIGTQGQDDGRRPPMDENRNVDFPKPPDDDSSWPVWAPKPEGVEIPPGVEIAFFRFKGSHMYDSSWDGAWCATWPLTDLDEKLAYQRAKNSDMAVHELAKGMIRIINGNRVRADVVSGQPGHLGDFWKAIGSKYRGIIIRYYHQSHGMNPDELSDFLNTCVAVRRSA